MRKYIRHPADIPIDVMLEEGVSGDSERLNNVSVGGLSYFSKRAMEKGSFVQVRIDSVEPAFEARAQVVWCKRHRRHFEIGLELLSSDDTYRARMVEQICHIEHYKRQVKRTEGRELSGSEAAMEWIAKYAKTFPALHDEN